MAEEKIQEQIKDMDLVKQIEIDVLDSVVKFCDENNLKYTLAYGTLLGAVRHKGFIPWDDDIDIMMPRPDYEKFIKLWKDGNNCRLLECTINPEYVYPFAKVYASNTKIVEHNIIIDYEMGIYIDIFPCDGIKGSIEDSKKFIDKIKFLEKCRIHSMMPVDCILSDNKIKNIFRKMLWTILKTIGPAHIARKINKLSMKYGIDNSTYAGFLSTKYPEREILPVDVFDASGEVLFENKKYKAPKDYDFVLSKSYGNYMEFPPEKDRVFKHNFKAWIYK